MSHDPIDLRARERDKIEEESKKRARRAAEIEAQCQAQRGQLSPSQSSRRPRCQGKP